MEEKYKAALAALNTAQAQAVKTTDGPVLVIAGPGTGKTQLLTTRIAHILATTDTLPQNILCLTFTDSAAQTMRERLSAMIGQPAYDVTISTYHAFGADLLRRYPDYFTEEANLLPVDDLGIDRILRGIVAELPYNNPLKYSDNYLPDIKTLISDAKRALLAPADLRAIARANLQFITAGSPIAGDIFKDMKRVDKKAIPLFEQLLAALTAAGGPVSPAFPHRAHSVARDGGPPRAATPDGSNADERAGNDKIEVIQKLFLQELEETIAQAQEIGKTTPLTAWKSKWLAKDADGRFVVDGAKANRKLEAAADIYQKYLAELAAQNLFDYDDMILRAVRALKENPDLRFTLQEQYLYMLLDEFQDTNGAQLRLVQLLSDNPVNEGRPNVLAVGDDDQAIYAFQGANYSHMLQFKEMYRDVLAVPLTENYRSDAGILHTARGIAEQIEERLHHHFPAIEKTLVARAPDLPKPAIVERREAQSDVMQFAWVAQRIRQLIEDGMPARDIAVLAPQHKYLEPLVPFLQQASVPVRYEKRENVLDDPAIIQLLRMSELVLALAAGDQPTANSLWAQVLSFDFWGLPTSIIWRLSWQSADDDHGWTDELLADEQLKPIALFFIRLSHLAGTETLETMLDYLIGSTSLDLAEPGYHNFSSPYYRHYFGNLTPGEREAPSGSRDFSQAEPGTFQRDLRLDGKFTARERSLEPLGAESNQQQLVLTDAGNTAGFWNLLSNLTVLRARLREYQPDGDIRLTLEHFIQYVTAMRAAELKILNTNPYASGTDAVELMTAFKAKGLEWRAVFVLAVNDEAWGGKSHAASARISLPPNLQFIRYAGATNDERLRLFYVAITRAKAQLYLVNYTSNYAGKTMSRLKFLNEAPDEQGRVQSPLLPEGHQTVLPAEDGAPAPSVELDAYWSSRHRIALERPDMRALLQDRLRAYQLSPTHLNDFTDVSGCGPHDFFLKAILRFPQASRPEMQFGSAMHETLEWLHHTAKHEGTLPTEQQLLAAFARLLERKRLTAHELEAFLVRGQEALRTYLAQRGAGVSADNAVEHNFRNEGVFVGRAHLSGKIDKLIIDRTAKTIHIVDYKTGRAHARWTRDVRLHKYRQQLYLYKALVEGSHTFGGYQVTGAHLEFIEPDEDGRIIELPLVFDDAELARTKHLAAVVWRRITGLNLPDTSAYTQDLAGIEAFENDLLKED
jgi:ATP-dependent DNA helicase UvrD/PcrA